MCMYILYIHASGDDHIIYTSVVSKCTETHVELDKILYMVVPNTYMHIVHDVLM